VPGAWCVSGPSPRDKDAEIAKHIGIAATAIFNGMTVDEVSDLALSYTPPFGSPWDAVQLGAQAWTRHLAQETSQAGASLIASSAPAAGGGPSMP
jgi:hypothetical protein